MNFKDDLIKGLQDNNAFLSLSEYQRMTIADIAEKQLLIHSVVHSKINVLVTWWNYVDGGHALLDDYKTKVSKVVQVDDVVDVNDMFKNIIDVKILN